MRELQLKHDQYVATFNTLLRNSLDFNETTNFTEKYDITRSLTMNLNDLHYLENSLVCATPYDQCTGLTQTQINQLMSNTDYRTVYNVFQSVKLVARQSGALILNPMFGYLNTTVGTKSELFDLIHSDDFNLNTLQILASVAELRKDQFTDSQRSITNLNNKLLVALGSLANCPVTILDLTEWINSTVLQHIQQNYLQYENIDTRWAKVRDMSAFNATEIAQLTNLAFEKQTNDVQTIVDTILNDTDMFSKYIAKVKRNLIEFEDLDSLILEV